MLGFAARLVPYALAFFSSLCIMILELVSSRLVARHCGASLTVWTSVIGIILGGICLGNVLGGRLADRVEPRRAVGPLFALGSLLVLGCLWVNAELGHIIPAPESINWELRTVLVVILDFLVPATVLGMVGPVVAKMAVEQSQRSGRRHRRRLFLRRGRFDRGDVPGRVHPHVLCPLFDNCPGGCRGVVGVGRGAGVVPRRAGAQSPHDGPSGVRIDRPAGATAWAGGIRLDSYQINYLALAGNVTALFAGVLGLWSLNTARREQLALADDADESVGRGGKAASRPKLADLAVLAFLASLAFMAMEMVAGRLVTRHLGSSIYGWTSVIAVLLAGLSLGNYLGGRVANLIRDEKQASWLFLTASVLTLSILFLESPPKWFTEVCGYGSARSTLSMAITWSELGLPFLPKIPLTWPYRVLLVTALVFFLPSVSMGTVSPVVAKLAVDRLKRFKMTGTAIGEVYAWGMVGSILGTFVTGFYLIDVIGTKGVLLVLATAMAFAATVLGTVWHAVWAGVPLGLCVVAFLPVGMFQKMGEEWGIREERGDPATKEEGFAWVDESKYYFIKITNEPMEDDENETQRRTLVLDNLIHGYFILNHPERLDYDYEHIYALVAYRAAKASGKITLADENAPATRRRPDGQAVADLPEQVFSSQDRGKAVSKPDAGSPGPGQGKAKEDEKTKKVVPGKPAQKAAEEDLHTPASPRREIDACHPVPGGRGLLLPEAYPVRLSRDRGRRGRDRPGRHQRQFSGHRPAPRHADQDLLGRCPAVRRSAPEQQAIRPDLRRRLQRFLRSLAPYHQRVQRQDRQDDEPEGRLYD